VIQYKKGYKYQLWYVYSITFPFPVRDYMGDFIWVSHNILTFEPGYAWDGPSGPTFDTKNAMRASLVHDGLYQLMRVGVLDRKYRKYADQRFYDICREDGMSYIRAKLWYLSLRAAGKGAASESSIKKVHTAP